MRKIVGASGGPVALEYVLWRKWWYMKTWAFLQPMGNSLHGGTWFGVGTSHLGLACKLASCILYSLHLHNFASLCTSLFFFSLCQLGSSSCLPQPHPSSGFISDIAGLFSSACHDFIILNHYCEGPALTLWDSVGLLLSWTFQHIIRSQSSKLHTSAPHRAVPLCAYSHLLNWSPWSRDYRPQTQEIFSFLSPDVTTLPSYVVEKNIITHLQHGNIT